MLTNYANRHEGVIVKHNQIRLVITLESPTNVLTWSSLIEHLDKNDICLRHSCTSFNLQIYSFISYLTLTE